MEISLLAGCTLFLGVPGSTKFTVAPSAAMASCLVIYIIDAEYYVSICLLVQLLMTIVLSSSSSVVDSSANILVVLCVVGYNELTVVGSIFFYTFYLILVLFPLTFILYIADFVVVVVVVVVYMYLDGPLPIFLSLVVARGYIPSLT